jgi:hypothetical protein
MAEMQIARWFKRLATATVMTLALAGTACAGPGRVYVQVAPPRPVVEARVVSPGPGYVWVAGYQRWERGGYVWVPGRWVRPPHPHSKWVAGHWSQERHHGWYYTDGHWR